MRRRLSRTDGENLFHFFWRPEKWLLFINAVGNFRKFSYGTIDATHPERHERRNILKTLIYSRVECSRPDLCLLIVSFGGNRGTHNGFISEININRLDGTVHLLFFSSCKIKRLCNFSQITIPYLYHIPTTAF